MLLRGDEKADPRLVRSKEPLNLEMPFGELKEFLTPTRLHYVRNHYAIPEGKREGWRLTVQGAGVSKRQELSLAKLEAMKATTLPVTLECAGNGRSFLLKKAKGVQWAHGAVGTAEWTGVPLADVLRLAGLKDSAVDIILDGADKGDPKKEGQPPAPVSFARSIPVAKAADVILAYAMNGKELPRAHGFPVRAIVPGWYGCASVKWLSRIIVTTEPFPGFDQTLDYGYWKQGDDGLPRLVPVTEMQPKASIAQPLGGAKLAKGEETRLFGAAWAGPSGVAKVEVSTDGGKTWQEAKLLDERKKWCWRRWEARWTPRSAGAHALQARATDGEGESQPKTHDEGRRSYMINFIQTTSVMVFDRKP
ncbi:MAG: sulfite oxidase [Gemmataceae bacterium]|nr:sulfite oxidase [Gemmataceae bacterium]